jgi:preprotein translocase subunit YajC
MNLFLTANAAGIFGNQTTIIIAYVVFLVAIMDFMLIRPQKKEEAKKKALMESLAVGDSILTTSGFYGIIKDMTDDTVIVEFGNNKNCRIPMQKSAIFKSEKPNYKVENSTDEK